MSEKKNNPGPLGERMARVETELKGVREDMKEIKLGLDNFKTFVRGKVEDFDRGINEVKVATKGKLSSRDKVAIYVALIASIGSIIVAIIQLSGR